jgi:hypothetical protein
MIREIPKMAIVNINDSADFLVAIPLTGMDKYDPTQAFLLGQ